MEETLVSFEVAKLLKEKGFNIWQNSFYNGIELEEFDYNRDGATYFDNPKYDNENTIYAPTLSLAQKWLREVHNIHIQIIFLPINNRFIFAIYKYGKEDIESVLEYETYELALEAALQEALKLI